MGKPPENSHFWCFFFFFLFQRLVGSDLAIDQAPMTPVQRSTSRTSQQLGEKVETIQPLTSCVISF